MSADISKMCRTCLISDAPLLSIFDSKDISGRTNSIVEMLQSISSIKASPTDGLPNSICILCISEINRAFLFKIKCETSQKTLFKLLNKVENQLETDVINVENNSIDKFISFNITKEENNLSFVDNSVAATEEKNDYEQVLQNYVDSGKNIDYTIDKTHHIDSIQEDFHENSEISILSLEISDSSAILKSNSKDKLKCPDCPQEFIHKKNLIKHKLKHIQNNKIIETDLHENKNISKKLIDDKEQLIKEHTTNDIMIEECILKPNSFPTIYTYKCKYCGAGFRVQKSLDFHIKLNRCTQKQFKCFVCKKVFISKNNLILHMDTHKKYFQCDKCEKIYEFEQALKEHLDNDHDGSNIKNQCPICRKSFTMLSALKDHMRIHSGEKPFLCSVCGKSFTQNTNLKQHIMRHSKIKPFKCKECYCEFVSRGELNSHIRKHTGEHPFVCDTCGSKFTTSSSLLKHKRIHTGERPYACDYCPMRFAALGTMKNHRRTHTGEKPFVCKICKRAFAQQSDCVTHMRTHTGERPYICPICGLSFQQSGTMKTHYKKLHKDVNVATEILEIENGI